MTDSIVIVSGGFDPVHSGHIKMIEDARQYGRVVIALNSDEWLIQKKGQPFMPFAERKAVLNQFKNILSVIEFDDSDGSATDSIQKVLDMFPNNNVIFANGGDRNDKNIPELDNFVDNTRVSFKFGVGGTDKANSSSWILQEWKSPKITRVWGYYRILHEDGVETKVKELVVNPGSQLSLQRHKKRSEHWIVTGGVATIRVGSECDYLTSKRLAKHQEIDIPVGMWHQLINSTDTPLKIVEIQHGNLCIEEDIERV
jgi:cytidyltransferase-like protein